MTDEIDLVCPYCGNHSLVARCQSVEDEDYPTSEYFYLSCMKCNTTHLAYDDLVPHDAYFEEGQS